MIDEIVKSTREACAVLERIKSMPREELEGRNSAAAEKCREPEAYDSGGYPDRYQKACHHEHQAPGFAKGKPAG